MPTERLSEVLALLRDALRGEYGLTARRVRIETFEDADHPVSLPIPATHPPTSDKTPPPPTKEPFIPNPFQEAILAALDGKAMRVDSLGAAVGDRSRLYKPNGIKELQEEGLVAYHTRKGYYSTMTPPEGLAE